MTELEATRLMLAGLELLGNALPVESEAHSMYVSQRSSWAYHLEALEQEAPPWDSEPPPAKPVAWAAVCPGDEVQAPNGQWYSVDSWARIGNGVVAILKLPTGGTTKTTRLAGDKVPTRRGATGQAADIFRAAGLELEQLGSVAA